MSKHLLLSFILLLIIKNVAAQSVPSVVVSIKPIHSITTHLMRGIGEPKLLLKSNNSAHTFHLKPSQTKMLAEADLVIMISEDFETGLRKAVKNIANDSLFQLTSIKNLNIHENRVENIHIEESIEPAEYKKNDKHEDHDEHDEHEDHDENEGDDEHDEHEGHDEHDEGIHDLHLWLDINNAKLIAKNIKNLLIKVDPNNTASYNTNFLNLTLDLEDLKQESDKQLRPYLENRFSIFSDTLQYFEKSHNLTRPVIITPYHGARLSIKRTLEAKNIMNDLKISCLLFDREVKRNQISVLSEGLDLKTIEIDILGSDLSPGVDLYFNLIKNLTTQVVSCLK